MAELKTNHNVRVVTLVTGERVLCLFGGIRSEEDPKKMSGYRLIYPYTLTLGQPNEDGTMPINYTRYCPFSPFEEHIISGDHIISVVLPDAQIFENYADKLREAGIKDEQIFYPEESNGDNSEPTEAGE